MRISTMNIHHTVNGITEIVNLCGVNGTGRPNRLAYLNIVRHIMECWIMPSWSPISNGPFQGHQFLLCLILLRHREHRLYVHNYYSRTCLTCSQSQDSVTVSPRCCQPYYYTVPVGKWTPMLFTLSCHKLSNLLGPLPLEAYFMDGPQPGHIRFMKLFELEVIAIFTYTFACLHFATFVCFTYRYSKRKQQRVKCWFAGFWG